MKNPTRAQVLVAFKNAPLLIQEASMSEGTAAVIENLGKKYQLHVDITGAISLFVGHLLIGITNPSEFQEEIIGLGLDQKTVTGVVNDVNQKIFIPLHEKMRGGEEMNVTIIKPVSSQSTSPQVPVPTPSASVPMVTAPQLKIEALELPRQTISSQLPPKNILPTTENPKQGLKISAVTIQKMVPLPANLPGMMPEEGATPSVNRLEGRTLPLPTSPPARSQSLPIEKTPVRPYTVDPYREEPDKK